VERREDIHFVAVGDQTNTIELPNGYHDHLTYVEPVNPQEISNYFRRADLLIHPSLTEGLPRVIAEALLTNTPVVARDVGDVAYATSNTFETDRELVNMIEDYESLNIDKSARFSRTALRSEYIEYFTKVSNNS
jgi:glycosyltransferase involved in cell wall biosynthesis